MVAARFFCVIAVTLVLSLTARGEDLRHKYVGGSGWSPGLKPEQSEFSVRLDREHGTYLVARATAHAKILVIVKYENDSDQCGVVLDVVESHDSHKDFEFDCVDPKMPAYVVVGTRDPSDKRLTSAAAESWRIDLVDQKFIPLR